MGSFVKMCGEYGKPINSNKLYEIASYINPESIAGMNLAGVIISAEKTKDSIMSSLHAMIRIFAIQKKLITMMAGNDFDMRAIGREKTAVYVMIPDEKSTYHFLATLFIKQCYETMIQEAQLTPDIRLSRRVNFVLDEFANIPAIPDMDAMITAARSRNMRFFLVVQSFHQLEKLYGENARTLTSNCENWIYLNSKEFDHLTEISNLCGNVYTTGGQIRPLIAPSQLLHLSKKKGEALILAARHYPLLTEMPDISDYAFAYAKAPELPENGEKVHVAMFDLNMLASELESGMQEELFYEEEEKIPEEYRTLNKDEALDLAAARLQDLIRLLEDTEMPYDDDDVPFTE